MQDFIRIHKNDNVAVALKPLASGTTYDVDGNQVTVIEEIPQGHKFALRDIAEGEDVIKYGFRIGTTKEAVKKGGCTECKDRTWRFIRVHVSSDRFRTEGNRACIF